MSFRRLISSRANAKRSTGPRTVAGKRRSSQNALRHGCRSRNLVIPDDQSRRDLNNRLQPYLSCLKPRNPAERICIDEMAAAKWRQKCLLATENRMVTEALASEPSPHADPETRTLNAFIGLLTVPGFAALSRYEVTEDRKYYRALRNLLDMKKQTPQKSVSLTTVATPSEHQEQPETLQPPATGHAAPASENKICTNEATLGFLYAPRTPRQTRNPAAYHLPKRFHRSASRGSPR